MPKHIRTHAHWNRFLFISPPRSFLSLSLIGGESEPLQGHAGRCSSSIQVCLTLRLCACSRWGRDAAARWEWPPGGEDGVGHAGACRFTVAGSPGTPPELLGTTTAETSAERARFSQSSVGYVRKASVEERLAEGDPRQLGGHSLYFVLLPRFYPPWREETLSGIIPCLETKINSWFCLPQPRKTEKVL